MTEKNCDYYCKTCKTCIKVLMEGVNMEMNEHGEAVCKSCKTPLNVRHVLHD